MFIIWLDDHFKTLVRIFTARHRRLRKVMFSVCLSVHVGGGGTFVPLPLHALCIPSCPSCQGVVGTLQPFYPLAPFMPFMSEVVGYLDPLCPSCQRWWGHHNPSPIFTLYIHSSSPAFAPSPHTQHLCLALKK